MLFLTEQKIVTSIVIGIMFKQSGIVMNKLRRIVKEEINNFIRRRKKKKVERVIRSEVRSFVLNEEQKVFDTSKEFYKGLNRLTFETAKEIKDKLDSNIKPSLETHRGGKRVYLLTKGIPYYEIKLKFKKEFSGKGTTNLKRAIVYTDKIEVNGEVFNSVDEVVSAIEDDKEAIEKTTDVKRSWKKVQQDPVGDDKKDKFRQRYKGDHRPKSVSLSGIQREMPAAFAGDWDAVIPGDLISYRADETPGDEFDININ